MQDINILNGAFIGDRFHGQFIKNNIIYTCPCRCNMDWDLSTRIARQEFHDNLARKLWDSINSNRPKLADLMKGVVHSYGVNTIQQTEQDGKTYIIQEPQPVKAYETTINNTKVWHIGPMTPQEH